MAKKTNSKTKTSGRKAATKKRPRKKTMRRRYEPVVGAHISKKDAVVIGDELDALRDSHGHVTARLVLERARRSRSKLHKFFDWDDTSAAEKYRLQQAGQLIRSIRVVIEGDDQPQREMRAYVNVVTEESRVYIPAIEAMSDEAYRQQLLDRALAELEAWRGRYDQMTEFAAIFDEIGAARARIKKVA